MSQQDPTANIVLHEEEQQRFVIRIDNEEVTLRYRRPSAAAIDFYSTFTPVSLRGRGLARQVVDAGLEYAQEHALEVIPTCSYVARVIERRQSVS